MPISFYHKKASIYVADYVDNIDPDDFCTHLTIVLDQLDRVQSPISFIADWRKADTYPIGYDMISLILKLFRHPNMGELIVLGMNPTLKFWGNIFTSLIGLQYRTANSLEEALKMLEVHPEQETTAKSMR